MFVYYSEVLGLWLGVEQGRYSNHDEQWLRWIDDDGRVLPCSDDLADAARDTAKQAQAEAQHAQAEAQQARARLITAGRALVAAGKQPAEVSLMLGLAVEELL